MLQRLNDHIRTCYRRAAQAEETAAQVGEPSKSHYLNLSNWWTHLARSYEFAQGFERFLLETESKVGIPRDRQNRQARWQRIATAPYDRDLRLAVLDRDGVAHALVFPCRRILGGWIKSETKARIQVDPTHWQEWTERP